MIQIKMFRGQHGNSLSLENDINSWLSSNKDVVIEDIKWHPDNTLLVMIIYRMEDK